MDEDKTNYGKPAFIPVVKWYEIMQDLEFRFIDYMVEGNTQGMVITYRYMLSKLYHLLEKHLNKAEKEKLSLDDIKKHLNQDTGDTDHARSIQDDNKFQLDAKIMEKIDLIEKKKVQAQIFLPLTKKMDLSKAILQLS